jgi:hypothetical protein
MYRSFCEGIEMIIRTETIEAKAGAEVGRNMETGTWIEVIVVVADLTVLALIMTGNIPDTGMYIGNGDVLFLCFVLSYLNASLHSSHSSIVGRRSPVRRDSSHSRSPSPRKRAPREVTPSRLRDDRSPRS